MVTTKDGCKRNGNLLFTIRPIQAALQQDYDRQMQKLDEDMAKRKYADFIENTGCGGKKIFLCDKGMA